MFALKLKHWISHIMGLVKSGVFVYISDKASHANNTLLSSSGLKRPLSWVLSGLCAAAGSHWLSQYGGSPILTCVWFCSREATASLEK